MPHAYDPCWLHMLLSVVICCRHLESLVLTKHLHAWRMTWAGCSADASCFNVRSGSVLCLCNQGFAGDGKACFPVRPDTTAPNTEPPTTTTAVSEGKDAQLRARLLGLQWQSYCCVCVSRVVRRFGPTALTCSIPNSYTLQYSPQMAVYCPHCPRALSNRS